MPQYQNKKTKLWKYRTYAYDIYGNRKQFEKGGFRTKREAKLAEDEFKNQDSQNEVNITFLELWESYKEHISLKQKKQSYRKTVSKFTNHILPYFKDYRLKSITANVYTKWQKEIEKKGFKYKYNSSLHGSVVTILNYAIKFYGLKDNIASKIGNFTKKNELPSKVDFWTLDEYQKFINVIEDQVYKTFFETLYYTGLRQGECLALTWKEFKNDYLDIYKTISKEKVDNEYVINSPKTKNSIRKIKLDNYLIESLNQLKIYYKNYVGFDDNWYIFGGVKPLSATTIGRKKNEYCELSNVKKIRIHDFRHSHASLLLSSGVPITVISQRLGHADINMTLNTYSHLIPKDEDKAINILNTIKSTNK